MCGICGWLNPDGVDLKSIVEMSRLASHRGPDGEGYWIHDDSSASGDWVGLNKINANLDRKGYLALGHRRLAIIDLSDAGLQPMPSLSRKHWIVFNGEIYNYLELRRELTGLGWEFQTQTDTEVILASYQQWGTDCFNRFNGMWGMAIVDLLRRTIVLSRDRLGVKPLYVWIEHGSLAFASEIKQFLALPNFAAAANPSAIREFIQTGYEIQPQTFFKNVQAFPPGCFAEIPMDAVDQWSPRRYWDVDLSVSRSVAPDQINEQLRYLFEDSVRLRLRSDVPVGVCLSGGLDSSAIYGQIQSLSSHPDNTHAFSASYHEKQFDESRFVNLVMDKHGGNIHYVYPSPNDFLDDFEKFVYQHDEPPGSLSQYAAWSVMRLARQNRVPVLLNGQGGDELFGGYWPAYYLYLRYQLSRSPAHVAGHLLGAVLPYGNPTLLREMPEHMSQYLTRSKNRNQNIMKPMGNTSADGRANWAIEAQQITPEKYRWQEISQIHLPRLLKWDDRNSMAFSIEGRYPFFDFRLVEAALQVPAGMNFHAGWNKYTMRKALGHLLPADVQWRRSKIGFVTPQSVWLNTVLKPILLHWAQNPSKSLNAFVDDKELYLLAQNLLASGKIHSMDERQHLLFRLFVLDRWLQVYRVSI